ncbi:MAG: ribosome-associated translation inhibitor RaiA [Acidobacteria bacterium]|nr:ribosome-associated translation inhibitor RaiA [Acidobacteriota bacterium]
MKVHFTGRHVEVSEALRNLANERTKRLSHYLDDIMDVHVVLTVEKHRHQAEVTLKTRQGSFVASAETDDMYVSLGQAMDRLQNQTHRHQERKNTKEHTSVRMQPAPAE